MDHIEECGMTEMPAAALPAPEMDKGNPVTINVNMNASGKDNVADLLDMMKNAGLGAAEEVGPKMLSPRMDMERLSGIMDEPGFDDKEMELPKGDDTDEAYSAGDENEAGMVSNCCSAPIEDVRNGTGRCSACGEGASAVEENYANEPDAQYGDMSDAIPDGNDLNRKKKSYAATQDGDNPMAVENIKAALYAALTEKKKTMVKGPDGKMVPDYAADGKGKGDLKKDTKTTEGYSSMVSKQTKDRVDKEVAANAAALAKKGKNPDGSPKKKDTAEGRGKVMAGRGRGKDKLMAGRGRGKKK